MKDKPRVLIAEDIDGNYFLLSIILGNSYEMFRARDGVEAVEMMRKDSYDLVLMDILMPRMNGMEATKEIRKFNTTTPIVAITAYAYDYLEEEAMECGFDGYLKKPFTSNVVKEEVGKYSHAS